LQRKRITTHTVKQQELIPDGEKRGLLQGGQKRSGKTKEPGERKKGQRSPLIRTLKEGNGREGEESKREGGGADCSCLRGARSGNPEERQSGPEKLVGVILLLKGPDGKEKKKKRICLYIREIDSKTESVVSHERPE